MDRERKGSPSLMFSHGWQAFEDVSIGESQEERRRRESQAQGRIDAANKFPPLSLSHPRLKAQEDHCPGKSGGKEHKHVFQAQS